MAAGIAGLEDVMKFLTDNGLHRTASALWDDMVSAGAGGDGVDAALLILPPLRTGLVRRGAAADGSDAASSTSSSSGDDDGDVFLSTGSSPLETESPYGNWLTFFEEADDSSDSMSDFRTAREYDDSSLFDNVYLQNEKYSGFQNCCCTVPTQAISSASEDKYPITRDVEELYEKQNNSGSVSGRSIGFLDIPECKSDFIFDNATERCTSFSFLDDTFQDMKVCHSEKGLDSSTHKNYIFSYERRILGEDGEVGHRCKTTGDNQATGCLEEDLSGLPSQYSNQPMQTDLLMFTESSADVRNNTNFGYPLENKETKVSSNNKNADRVVNFTTDMDEHQDYERNTECKEEPAIDFGLGMDHSSENEHEIFELRIIHRKNRTGFEENKDLSVVINSVVAGRYYVTEHLGSAAFSKVFQARDLQTGLDVCLKIIKNNKDFFDQSLDEIKLLKFVNKHDPADEKHILRLYDYFYHQEHLFIVCELLKANLYEFQKYNRESGEDLYFTIPRIQAIARQCLKALDYMHCLGLIHCDLKPENILIRSYTRCEIKIIDLGSSCFVTDNLCLYVQSRSYRAPEVILGLPYDQRIDIWSLGCVIAELYSGDVLFANESIVMMLARMIGVLGPLDLEMIDDGQETHKYFTENYDLYHKNEETGQTEYIIPQESTLADHINSSDPAFNDFLLFLLQANPKLRPTAKEALQHPWLTLDINSF